MGEYSLRIEADDRHVNAKNRYFLLLHAERRHAEGVVHFLGVRTCSKAIPKLG